MSATTKTKNKIKRQRNHMPVWQMFDIRLLRKQNKITEKKFVRDSAVAVAFLCPFHLIPKIQ